MEHQIKSGKEVIEEFFTGIFNIQGTDKNTTSKLIQLYRDNKLNDRNIQMVLEELKQDALNPQIKPSWQKLNQLK